MSFGKPRLCPFGGYVWWICLIRQIRQELSDLVQVHANIHTITRYIQHCVLHLIHLSILDNTYR